MSRLPIALVSTLAFGFGLADAQQQARFREDNNTVSLYATVVDRQGRLVPGLTATDFEVYDNGQRRELSLFASDPQPITIVIMLDRSGSVATRFSLVRDAATAFVANMAPQDRARLGTFSRRIEIEPADFTSDRDALLRILHGDLQEAGPTPLWNATAAAITALRGQVGRRVVLMFTDGQDSPLFQANNSSFEEVRLRVEEEDVMVYGIGLSAACGPVPAASARPIPDEVALRADGQRRPGQRGRGRGGPPRISPPVWPPVRPPAGRPSTLPSEPRGPSTRPCRPVPADPNLRVLAELGGGGYFELDAASNLRATFARVADELRQQYLLAFTADTLDETTHQLQVRMLRNDLRVRARQSYRATRAGSPR